MIRTFSQPVIRKVISSRRFNVSSSIIFLLLVAVLVSVVMVWLKGKSGRFMASEQVTPARPATLVFRNILIADGVTEDNFKYVSYSYKASDCVPISYAVIFFDSPTRAQDELQKKTTKAAAILERGAAKDEKQTVVGERVVIRFPESDKAKAHAAIVLTENSNFISITSPSLNHLLEFEKAQMDPEKRTAFPGIDSVRKVTFSSSSSTQGVTSDGVPFKREEFTTSDCEKLVSHTWYFQSSESAQKALEQHLKQATEISGRGDKINSAGQRVGTRVVANFEADPSSGYLELTHILWTEGSLLRSIEGGYIYALEFDSRGATAISNLASAKFKE